MPVGPRCGDEAEYDYEVDSELIGLFASVFIERQNTPGITADSSLEIKKTITTVVWPDLDDGKGSFYGGRKFDSRGLAKKSYQDKFIEQKFKLTIMCVGEEKGSGDTIEIKEYDNAGPQTLNPQMAIVNHGGWGDFFGQIGFKKAPKFLKVKHDYVHPMGCFDIEYKDGEVIITTAVALVPKHPKLPSAQALFKKFKKVVEGFWNGPQGFGRFVLHRTKCVRLDKCNCSVIYDQSKKLVSGGCCKIPVRLVVEQGNRHGQTFNVYKKARLFPIRACAPIPHATNAKKYGGINYPAAGANVWAHEVGHCIGFPDQYLGGHILKGAPGKFPMKSSSIMNSGNRADEDHFHYAEEWANKNIEKSFKVIKR